VTTDDDDIDLLVAYALGTLTPDEAAEIGRLLERRPELRVTLAELQETADRIPLALPPAEPPPELRQRTLDYAVGRVRRAPAQGLPAVQRLRRWIAGLGMLAAAAAMLAGLAWVQLAAARADLQRAQAELATLRLAQQQLVAIAAQPQALVALSGRAGSGSVVRAADGTTVVAARLPALDPGRVYQLWLIAGNGAPVSGGTFTVNEQGYGTVVVPASPQALGADTFAVTNEPAPGSPAPTSPILIAGKAPIG
jgi:anti-sigma-K factor RskA